MNEEKIDISEELRKYFDREKATFSDLCRQTDEFTSSMFREQMGLSNRVALYELDKRVAKGELTVRVGHDDEGRSCNLYKLVSKQSAVLERRIDL